MNNMVGDGISRKDMLATIGLAALCATGALALYYLAPITPQPRQAIWWRLAIALVLFVAVAGHEIRAILRDDRPMRRAVIALAVVIPLFVVLFSWLYLIVSKSNPAAFGTKMSHTEALYFTVTVLSTVGFGDITPKTDPARLLVTAQMVSDLILVAIVVKLILGTASRARERRGTQSTPEQGE